MTEQYWADAATANNVWCFQTRQQEWQEPNEELVNYWLTERVFLTKKEALFHGYSRLYAWGEKDVGWRIWGVPCDGRMATILGVHNKEFEDEVEYITNYAADVNPSTDEVEVVWPQSEIKERFVGVGSDLNDWFLEEMELNKKFPLEFRKLHEMTVIKALEYFKCTLEDRFNELNTVPPMKRKEE